MASKKEITCACGCKRTKMVRNADLKRGWGKYFNKSCKAKHQMKIKPQIWDNYQEALEEQERNPTFSDAHKFSNED